MQDGQRPDSLGAFVPGTPVTREGAQGGPLSDLTFAAKDIFDVAGTVTGCGNPDWARTHAPAEADAPTVAALLEAGARLVGKTITDELAYSLNGQNYHYGTPTNSNAPGRIPGGSSCGSAAAVAGGAVEAALGSDTGGSVRVPASYCGLYGLRPTHGRIPLDGVMPLAPSCDTVGWFARDAAVLRRVGEILMDAPIAPLEPERLILAVDALQLAAPEAYERLMPVLTRLQQRFGGADGFYAGGEPGLLHWMKVFRVTQGHEIWRVHGPWITETQPRFGPEIEERFQWAASIDDESAAAADAERRDFAERLRGVLEDGVVLCLPTAPSIALRLDAGPEGLREHRGAALSLTCIAGLAGLPQITLPLASLTGCPLGVSLIAGPGGDEMLLGFAALFAGEDEQFEPVSRF
ncbi:MAG: amidase [Rhodovibrionaceae bacterium]|nr:amidase [Rhodovibrionaceae bacterium]